MAVVTVDTLLSAVAYVAGETIDIQSGAIVTCDATPAIRPGSMQSLVRGELLGSNASGTTPIVLTLNTNTNDFIFEQNGILKGRGAPISLGAATGGASETFDLSVAPLNIIPYPSHVEVETVAGSGSYYCYMIAPTAGVPVTWATTEFCATGQSGRVLFWNHTTRILTSGDGTNGSLLPAGADVRIPNIYIDTNVQNATPNARTQIDLNPSGTMDLEWVAFSHRIYLSTSTFKKVRFLHVGFCGDVNLTSANVAEYTMDHVSQQPDTEQTTVDQIFRASSVNGPMALNKVTVLSGGLVTRDSPSQVHNNFGLTQFDDCSFARRDGKNAGGDESISVQNLPPGLVVRRLAGIGGRMEFTNLVDNVFVDTAHAESLGTAQLTANAATATSLINCNGVKYLGFLNAGVSACRSELFLADGQCQNNELYNANYNGGNNCSGLSSGSDAGFKAVNCTLSNLRGDQPFVQSPTTFLNNQWTLRNVKASIGSGTFIGNDGAQNSELNFIAGTPANLLTPFAAATGYCYANLIGPGLTPTTGALVAGPFSENTNATLAGTAFYNQNGGIFLIAINDAISVSSLFSPVGITSFVNTAPIWTYTEGGVTNTNTATAPTGVTAEFRIRVKGGSYGTYQALSAANLSASIAALTGYDSDLGLDFDLQLTATGADTTRVINKVYFATNIDNTYVAPDGELNLLGPALTDVTTMYLDSSDASIATFTSSGAQTFSGSATYFGQDIYFIRRTSGAVVIVSTKSTPITMTIGDNGDIALFSGAEIQLAQSTDVTELKAYVETYLDVVMSTISSKVDEIHLFRGLDAANPMTTTQTEITAGAITLDLTGDGLTTTTVTRRP